MGLKFRRGTTAQKSGSLAFGEPYVNTTLGTLQVGGPDGDITLGSTGTGSTGTFGAISGSGLDITGNANIAGNLTLGGQLTIGDNTSDTVNVVASLSSSLIPSQANTFDLGSENYFWRDLYISTGSIKFVGEAGTVVGTLSNSANGLQLDSNLTIKQSGSVEIVEIGRRDLAGTSVPNIVIGRNISPNLTTGEGNIGIGNGTLYNLTTGNQNIAIGDLAGYTISDNSTDNIAIGTEAAKNMSGSLVDQNVFIGKGAGKFLQNGSKMTAIGANALSGIDGNYSAHTQTTALGYAAGTNLIGDSQNNILLGAYAGPISATEESNKFYISTGNIGDQPYMYGNLSIRTLDINASTYHSGSIIPESGSKWNVGTNAKPWNIVIANSISGAIAATNGVVSGSSQVTLSSTTGGGTSADVQFGSLGIGMAASGVSGEIKATGDIIAFASSDNRLKENIKPIENALDKVSKISGNTYDWKTGFEEIHSHTGEDVGVIAQEIEAVLPQLVTTREHGYKAVQYEKLTALLIEAIKEQQTQIHSLTLEIEKLKEQKGL